MNLNISTLANLIMSAPAKVRKHKPKWNNNSFKGIKSVEDAIIKKVNALRKQKGLPALKSDERLRVAARQHTQEMISKNYYSHKSPVAAWSLVRRRSCYAGFLDPFVAENIGNTNDKNPASALFIHWKKSPGHYKNMVHKKMTHIGIGVAKTKRGGVPIYFATQLFAAIPIDFRKLAMSQVNQKLFRLQVNLTMKNGTAVLAWDGSKYLGTLSRVNGVAKLKVNLPKPLSSKKTFVFALKDAPNKPALVCSRVFVDQKGRVKTKHYSEAPMCKPITSVKATIKSATVKQWMLRGEAKANTSTAATKTRFFINKTWGRSLPLKLGAWKAFSQPMPSKRSLFALVLHRLLKEYLYIDPTSSTKTFQCP
jgi:uncharacterized protein YkwD